jgi:azurin
MLRPTLFLLGLILAAHAGAAPLRFTIKTLPAQMRYDVAELIVQIGTDVRLTFENPDDMPHNIVFFQPGTNVVEVCNKQMEKPDEALKRNWLPEDPRMWLHSKTLNPREKDELVFKAPEKPGIYPFVCTMPGHAMIMNGKLRVVIPGPEFTDLKYALYLGDWQMLPDFAKLKPHREGDVAGSLIDFKFDDYKNQFAVVFTGKLKVPTNAEYTFDLTSDDGSRLYVDGQKVVEFDGLHPSSSIKQGKVKLKPGEHVVRVEYFQQDGGSELYVGWTGPNFNLTPLSKWTPPNTTRVSKSKPKVIETGIPLIVEKEPVLYRNFIEGAGKRGIAVGYPGRVNIGWNAESLNLALVWRGAFIDAAKHWNGRGGGYQRPLGFDVLDQAGAAAPPFAVLATPNAEWPKLEKEERPQGYQWKGYTLDAKRYPTFQYDWNSVHVSERYEGTGDAISSGGKLVRTLELKGEIPKGAMFRVLGGAVRPRPEGGFLVDSATPFFVEVDGATVVGNNLLVPARATLKVTYGWPSTHGGHAGHAGHAPVQ